MVKKKIVRNTSTPEGKAFWDSAERVAAQVDSWPASKRAGINVSAERIPSAAYRVVGHQKNEPCPRCNKRTFCVDCGVCRACHFCEPDEVERADEN